MEEFIIDLYNSNRMVRDADMRPRGVAPKVYLNILKKEAENKGLINPVESVYLALGCVKRPGTLYVRTWMVRDYNLIEKLPILKRAKRSKSGYYVAFTFEE